MGLLRGLAEALILHDPPDIDSAIECDRESIRLSKVGSEERAIALYGLGGDLLARYRRSPALADLRQAIECVQKAVALTSGSSPNRVHYLCTLAKAQSLLYDVTGERQDLEDSIAASRQALDLLSVAPFRKIDLLNQLSSSLRDRYSHTGDLLDLESAINLSQQALDAAPKDPRSRAIHLLSLALGLQLRYDQNHDDADLAHAISLLDEALTAPSLPVLERVEVLSTLAAFLFFRSKKLDDAGDLNKSIDYWDQAVKLAPPTAPQYLHTLNGWAGVLMARFDREQNTADVDQAIELFGKALALAPETNVGRATYLGNLAIALGKRYEKSGQPEDLDQARRHFRDSVTLGLKCRPGLALKDSLVWADWAFLRRSWAEASEAFALSFQAVDDLLRNQMSRSGKETWLAGAQDLASHAAFVRARIGDLRGAVEALEHGRARLLAEAQERSRIDLEKLRESGHADLYEALQIAVHQADRLESSYRAGQAADDWAVDAGLKAAQARLQSAATAIRQIPGYDDLFAAPEFDQIHRALTADGGVAVYLTVTRAGGVALIVRSEGVRRVWLDFDSADLVHRLVQRDQGRVTGGYGPALFNASRLSGELDELLPWLSKKVIEPLLSELGIGASPPLPDDQPAPSVLLVPTGYLGILPLHACSHELAGAPRAALKDCAFSYVLSAGSLAQSRAQVASAGFDLSLLAIGNPLPLPQGFKSLTFARVEVERIARLFRGRSELLCESQATREELAKRLGFATHLHFACHAQFNANQPLSSGFFLSGGNLQLGDVMKLPKFNRARLAVLSACQTAITDFNHLPEEAIGLPAGFLQTGVPGVIGTLWQVDDVSTALLLIKFYEYWFAQPRLHPAQALRRSQLWLQNVSCGELAELLDSYRSSEPNDPVEGKFSSFARRDPAEKPYSQPYYWAPFAFYGA